MRFNEIVTERRQQRTQIMYHGTSTELVPSILKHGLLARSPKKTYDVDTYGAATASMGGVYVTPDRGFAETIAEEAVGAHGGKPALVTLQYVLGSADTDEDELTQVISDAVSDVMSKLKKRAPQEGLKAYSALSYPQEGWAVDYMIKNKTASAAAVAQQAVQDLNQQYKVRQTVEQIIQKITMQLLIAAGNVTDTRQRWDLIRFRVQETIRENMEALLNNLMKQVSVDGAAGHDEGARRIDRDVKFKGKTRILKIESPIGTVVYTAAQNKNESVEEAMLDEQPVLSSWIADITLANDGSVTITLGNDRRYSVKAVGDQIYQAWIAAPSKGKFWHQQIKNNHAVVRLM